MYNIDKELEVYKVIVTSKNECSGFKVLKTLDCYSLERAVDYARFYVRKFPNYSVRITATYNLVGWD